GPATVFQVNPAVTARAGFTPQEVELDASAIMQGEPAPPPVVLNDRAYTIRVRFPESTRASVASIANTLLVSSTGRTATLGSLTSMVNLPGQTEIQRDNLQRDVTVTARLEGLDLGSGIAAVQNAIAALHLPPGIRIEYGGGYRQQVCFWPFSSPTQHSIFRRSWVSLWSSVSSPKTAFCCWTPTINSAPKE